MYLDWAEMSLSGHLGSRHTIDEGLEVVWFSVAMRVEHLPVLIVQHECRKKDQLCRPPQRLHPHLGTDDPSGHGELQAKVMKIACKWQRTTLLCGTVGTFAINCVWRCCISSPSPGALVTSLEVCRGKRHFLPL